MSIHLNTAIFSSATIERLFSVGKDVLKPKRSLWFNGPAFRNACFFKRSMQPINGVLNF